MWDTIPDHLAQLKEDVLPSNDVLREWLTSSLRESTQDRESTDDIVRAYNQKTLIFVFYACRLP